MNLTPAEKKKYKERLDTAEGELRELYMGLYDNEESLEALLAEMGDYFAERSKDLKKLDRIREVTTHWYKSYDIVGMLISVDNFADTLSGLEKKLGYLQKTGINFIELLPILECPRGSDIFAPSISNHRKVRRAVGTMEDLVLLTDSCHRKKINTCISIDMNHTSMEHIWAKKACKQDDVYKDYYIFTEDGDLVNSFDETVPQELREKAPGNFTYLPELQKYVMTTFYPDQWDLNYRNPLVFNEMVCNILFLANQGVDVIKLEHLSYIWKEEGTDCRNNPEIHILIRMLRLILETVCPGTVILGDVIGETGEQVSYFGTEACPECHLLYNKNLMSTEWHTVATRDCKLLKNRLDYMNTLPKSYTFINCIRNTDELTWNLDFELLAGDGIDKKAHIDYLNQYFTGNIENSDSEALIYKKDPISGSGGICGTTASLSGIERAVQCNDNMMLDMALREAVLHHVFLFMNSGIPMICYGDEIGMLNDYSFQNSKRTAYDERNVLRGRFDWKKAQEVRRSGSIPEIIHEAMVRLSEIKKNHRAFNANADTWTMDTWDAGTLALGRYYDGEKIVCIFNFSEHDRTAWINEDDGEYIELFTGRVLRAVGVNVPAYTFRMLMKDFGS